MMSLKPFQIGAFVAQYATLFPNFSFAIITYFSKLSICFERWGVPQILGSLGLDSHNQALTAGYATEGSPVGAKSPKILVTFPPLPLIDKERTFALK